MRKSNEDGSYEDGKNKKSAVSANSQHDAKCDFVVSRPEDSAVGKERVVVLGGVRGCVACSA